MSLKRILPLVLLMLLTAGISVHGNAQVRKVGDIVYGHKAGMALVMDVYQPENPNGAGIAYMISGGWMSSLPMQGAYESMFLPLVDAGFTVFAIRHGSSPYFNVLEAYQDVALGFQHAASIADTYGVDPERIGVSGISAGGHLSLMLGLRSDYEPEGMAALGPMARPAAVVAYMPPTNLRGMTGPNDNFPALDFDAALAPSVSPVDFTTPDDPPVLLVHGDADELVDISHSHNMLDALQDADIESELVVIEGAPHGLFTGEGGEKAADALLGWMQAHLLD